MHKKFGFEHEASLFGMVQLRCVGQPPPNGEDAAAASTSASTSAAAVDSNLDDDAAMADTEGGSSAPAGNSSCAAEVNASTEAQPGQSFAAAEEGEDVPAGPHRQGYCKSSSILHLLSENHPATRESLAAKEQLADLPAVGNAPSPEVARANDQDMRLDPTALSLAAKRPDLSTPRLSDEDEATSYLQDRTRRGSTGTLSKGLGSSADPMDLDQPTGSRFLAAQVTMERRRASNPDLSTFTGQTPPNSASDRSPESNHEEIPPAAGPASHSASDGLPAGGSPSDSASDCSSESSGDGDSQDEDAGLGQSFFPRTTDTIKPDFGKKAAGKDGKGSKGTKQAEKKSEGEKQKSKGKKGKENGAKGGKSNKGGKERGGKDPKLPELSDQNKTDITSIDTAILSNFDAFLRLVANLVSPYDSSSFNADAPCRQIHDPECERIPWVDGQKPSLEFLLAPVSDGLTTRSSLSEVQPIYFPHFVLPTSGDFNCVLSSLRLTCDAKAFDEAEFDPATSLEIGHVNKNKAFLKQLNSKLLEWLTPVESSAEDDEMVLPEAFKIQRANVLRIFGSTDLEDEIFAGAKKKPGRRKDGAPIPRPGLLAMLSGKSIGHDTELLQLAAIVYELPVTQVTHQAPSSYDKVPYYGFAASDMDAASGLLIGHRNSNHFPNMPPIFKHKSSSQSTAKDRADAAKAHGDGTESNPDTRLVVRELGGRISTVLMSHRLKQSFARVEDSVSGGVGHVTPVIPAPDYFLVGPQNGLDESTCKPTALYPVFITDTPNMDFFFAPHFSSESMALNIRVGSVVMTCAKGSKKWKLVVCTLLKFSETTGISELKAAANSNLEEEAIAGEEGAQEDSAAMIAQKEKKEQSQATLDRIAKFEKAKGESSTFLKDQKLKKPVRLLIMFELSEKTQSDLSVSNIRADLKAYDDAEDPEGLMSDVLEAVTEVKTLELDDFECEDLKMLVPEKKDSGVKLRLRPTKLPKQFEVSVCCSSWQCLR